MMHGYFSALEWIFIYRRLQRVRSKILVSINGTSPDLVVCLFLWSCGINFNSLVCAWLTTILCFHKVSIYHFMIMFITNIAIVYAWSISDTCFESDTLQYNDYVMNLFDKWREDSPPIYSIMVFFFGAFCIQNRKLFMYLYRVWENEYK